MLVSRRVRLGLVGMAVVVLAAAAWVAYQAWQLNRDLNAAVADAERARSAVESGDEAALKDAVSALDDSSGRAADRASSRTWTMLTRLPVYGDDVEGVRITSDVLHDLTVDGVEPLASVVDRLGQLLPQGGTIPVSAVEELQEPVIRAERAFAAAEERLSKQDPSGFVGSLRTDFTQFRDQVSDASDAMTSARLATHILPPMLGSDRERSYILAVQNNAEIRATGGLPGAVSRLRVEEGTMRLDRQLTGSAFPNDGTPVLAQTRAEQAIFDGVPGTFFQSSNMTPDVPRVAELMRAHWQGRFPNDRIDGVVLVDIVAVSYILEATGPIMVDGLELTSDNLVDELLHNTYKTKTAVEQDAFFAKVARVAFGKFTDGSGDPLALVRALAKAAGQHRMFVHSFDEADQDLLSGTAVAGELVVDPAVKAPQIQITYNDTTGSKMSYFLRSEVDVKATSCVDGVQTFAAKARLRSTAPKNAATMSEFITGGGNYGTPPGDQLVTVRIYGPVGGTISKFELNAEPMNLYEVNQDARPVGTTYLQFGPGQILDLSWTMSSGKGQTGEANLAITPTLDPADNVRSLESVC